MWFIPGHMVSSFPMLSVLYIQSSHLSNSGSSAKTLLESPKYCRNDISVPALLLLLLLLRRLITRLLMLLVPTLLLIRLLVLSRILLWPTATISTPIVPLISLPPLHSTHINLTTRQIDINPPLIRLSMILQIQLPTHLLDSRFNLLDVAWTVIPFTDNNV